MNPFLQILVWSNFTGKYLESLWKQNMPQKVCFGIRESERESVYIKRTMLWVKCYSLVFTELLHKVR